MNPSRARSKAHNAICQRSVPASRDIPTPSAQTPGVSPVWGMVTSGMRLLRSVSRRNGGDHGHARSQDERYSGQWVEADLDRQTLHHLDKVARGVFRGEEAKD